MRVRRDKILQAVRDSCPELYHFVGSAYCTPSSVFCGDHILQSEEGVQQGDPLVPLLFCLTIHPLVSQLRSEFKVFYLDDGTLRGSVESVLRDLHRAKNDMFYCRIAEVQVYYIPCCSHLSAAPDM